MVAYGGASPISTVTEDQNIKLCLISPPCAPPALCLPFGIPSPSKIPPPLPCRPAWLRSLPRLLALILKAVQQALALLWTMLFALPRADILLMQCPPAVPAMALCLFTCRLHGTRMIIDWHNFGYSLLALSLGDSHPMVLHPHAAASLLLPVDSPSTRARTWQLSAPVGTSSPWPVLPSQVRLSLAYEKRLGRLADSHFCVTRAMQKHLGESWGIRSSVLYDCPPNNFRLATAEEAGRPPSLHITRPPGI